MTKLIVEIKDASDIPVARMADAEIVILSGSLLQLQDFHTSLKKETGYSPRIWVKLDNLSEPHSDTLKALDAEALVVEGKSFWTNPVEGELEGFEIIASCETSDIADMSFVLTILSAGIHGLLLLHDHGTQGLLTEIGIESIARFLACCRQSGLSCGIVGNLEAPDIPRLLLYHPDWLGFIVRRPAKSGQFGDAATISLIHALLSDDKSHEKQQITEELGTDRIIVEDFILPMEIGVYSNEFHRKQKVRFNVCVDVMRLSDNPKDMRHIFSYDLILDGIRNLVTLGHVELVETLAERVAAFILAFPRVKKVVVRVDKLELGPAAVGIEIERIKAN